LNLKKRLALFPITQAEKVGADFLDPPVVIYRRWR
jgi:hypothetical protein